MDKKQLKKLRRIDLFELLVSQAKEIDRLERENEILKQKLADKTIIIDKAGSIAEAAFRLNDIFEVAQKTADQYLENVKKQVNNHE